MFYIKVLGAGAERKLEASRGEKLLEVLSRSGIRLGAPCGGRGTCGKCKVIIKGLTYDEKERSLLSDRELAEGVHLACRVLVDRDMEVVLPESEGMRIITSGSADIQADQSQQGKYAAGVDIGTTTVVCYLIDLGAGEVIDTEAAPNAQGIYGADVISRLSYAEEKGVAILQGAICSQLSEMLLKLLTKNDVEKDSLLRVVMVGNTTMIHFLCGWEISGLCRVPFHPHSVATQYLKPEDLHLPLDAATQVILPAGYSAFVGSDISAAVLASGLYQGEEIRMLADLGTNGELVIGNQDKMLCTSVAAGPAFEGGNISCGMPGLPGAISEVIISDGKPVFSVIGNGKAKGICGSGLLDLIAVLLKLEILDETGLLDDDALKEVDGEEVYPLTDEVFLAPSDIRSVQLAKSAVFAGIQILMKEYGTTPDQIRQLLLAGGFGSKLNPESAAAISLIPPELLERTKGIGNGAGMGAILTAANPENIKVIEKITQSTPTVELASRPDFMDTYVEAMLF